MNFDRKKNRVFALIFIAVWAVFTVVNFLIPVKDFSEDENRKLDQFPYYTAHRLLSGEFMEGMNGFLDDQFLLRTAWVRLHSAISRAIGMREISGIYVTDGGLYKHYLAEDDACVSINREAILTFYERTDIPTALCLVPSSSDILSANLPLTAESWDERAFLASFYQSVSPEILTVDVGPVLAAHAGEYIYYRNDHHWTTYGAFLALQELAPVLGWEEAELSDFTVTELSDSFRGTYHSAAQIDAAAADTMELYERGSAVHYTVNTGNITQEYDSIYFPDFLGHKDKYSYYLGQVHPVVTITTASQSGKKLLLFKDSYAHCLVPMLLEEYSEIRLVDLRYYAKPDWYFDLDIERYDQALFLFSCDVFGHQRVGTVFLTAESAAPAKKNTDWHLDIAYG